MPGGLEDEGRQIFSQLITKALISPLYSDCGQICLFFCLDTLTTLRMKQQ